MGNDPRSDILAYSLAEKIKSGLIWASQLVEVYVGQAEGQRAGSAAIIRTAIAMVAHEVELARKLLAADQWQPAAAHLNKALVMADSGIVHEATIHLTRALSQVTTIGQRAMRRLIDQGLL